VKTSQKKSSKISGSFNRFFLSSKPKRHRLVFFVLLAVLVLGASANFALAKPTTPTPLPGSTKTEVLAQGWTWPSSWIEQDATSKLPSDAFTFRYFLTENGLSSSEANVEAEKIRQSGKLESVVNSAQNTANVQTPPVGSSGEGFMETMLFAPIIAALYIIATFLKEFVGVAGNVLDITLSSSLYNFTSNQMIVTGWLIIRDICNLFFLLVLLFIAICTILQIPKYHAKKTLLTLIIMALLINFSKPIAIFIFDGSQLLMNMFLSKMGEGNQASTMYSNATGIANIIYNNVESWNKAGSSSGGIAIQYLFAIVFLFMLFVAYIVVAIFLIIRVVAVMLLIIVSPFAFFAAIVPDFSKMSSSWWDAMFKYCYYGPAAAFFLYLATSFSKYLPELSQSAGTSASLDILIKNIIHYLIVLIFLYASIIMSKQFGIFASNGIVGNANKFMKWGAKIGGTGLLAAGTLGQYWRAKDAAKGTLSGISQRPGMSWLTKESREKNSKERQARAAERFAPFNIAAVRKKQKELENESHATVDRGVARGDSASIMEAARRGRLSVAQLNANRDRLIQYADFRNDVFKNLKESGNSHMQYDFEIANAAALGTSAVPNNVYDHVYGRRNNNDLVENQNLRASLQREEAAGGNSMLARLDGLELPALQQLQNRTKDPGAQFVIQRLITRRNGGFAPGTATHVDLT